MICPECGDKPYQCPKCKENMARWKGMLCGAMVGGRLTVTGLERARDVIEKMSEKSMEKMADAVQEEAHRLEMGVFGRRMPNVEVKKQEV